MSQIRGLMAGLGVTQASLGAALGFHHSDVSRILAGIRRPPQGFIERATAVLDAFEEAEQAAEEARRRVLAEHESAAPPPAPRWRQAQGVRRSAVRVDARGGLVSGAAVIGTDEGPRRGDRVGLLSDPMSFEDLIASPAPSIPNTCSTARRRPRTIGLPP